MTGNSGYIRMTVMAINCLGVNYNLENSKKLKQKLLYMIDVMENEDENGEFDSPD